MRSQIRDRSITMRQTLILGSDLAKASVLVLVVGISLSGCAQTSPPSASATQQWAIQNPAPPSPALQPPMYPSSSNSVSGGQFEQPPVVNISELLPVGMQSGPG